MSLVVLVIVIVIFVAVRSRGQWRTVASGSGESIADVEAKYAILKENGVKCRTRASEAMGAVPGAAQGQGGTRLEVPVKFVDQANALLDEFGKKLPF